MHPLVSNFLAFGLDHHYYGPLVQGLGFVLQVLVVCVSVSRCSLWCIEHALFLFCLAFVIRYCDKLGLWNVFLRSFAYASSVLSKRAHQIAQPHHLPVNQAISFEFSCNLQWGHWTKKPIYSWKMVKLMPWKWKAIISQSYCRYAIPGRKQSIFFHFPEEPWYQLVTQPLHSEKNRP